MTDDPLAANQSGEKLAALHTQRRAMTDDPLEANQSGENSPQPIHKGEL
jgi:hypothetical protein